jgi:hypothetical protein
VAEVRLTNAHDDPRYTMGESGGYLIFRSRINTGEPQTYAFHVETGRAYHAISGGNRMAAGSLTGAMGDDRSWLMGALQREGWLVTNGGRELRPPIRTVQAPPAAPVGAPPRTVALPPALAVKRHVKRTVVQESTCAVELDEWRLRTLALKAVGIDIPETVSEVAFKITESNGLEVSWIEKTTKTEDS